MRYHNITTDDMLNGDGLRVVLWVSGCEHNCVGCHNPITHDASCGLEFDAYAYNELIDKLDKDYISGLTLSGGDPLYPLNRECIGELILKIKEKFPKKTIWLYTGYLWEEIAFLEAVRLCDVVVDGRFEMALADKKLHWRGSKNQRVIDVKKTIAEGKIVLRE